MKIQVFRVGSMQTNCYFLTDNKASETAVVDPGADGDRLLEKLSEKELRCTKILLTHAHFDHIMSLEMVRRATGAKVYVHTDDAKLLCDDERNLAKGFTGESLSCRPADILLSNGDIVTLGEEKLRVLHTPGHTPGSVCYITDGAILSGDTLFRGDIGRYDLPGGDYDALIRSLAKLSALTGEYKIYPGHGASTSLEYEKANNLYMK